MKIQRRWAIPFPYEPVDVTAPDHFARIPFTDSASSVIRLTFENRCRQAPVFG
jgi:hypothetical protein